MENVINNRNPMIRIIEKESTLFFKNISQPLFGFGLIPQMIFKDVCISAKIAEAPKSMIPKPNIAVKDELFDKEAFPMMC